MTAFDTATWTRVEPPRPAIPVTIDGTRVEVTEGSTILDACTKVGVEVPTMCFGETLTARSACRVCVVEVEGARTLAPACSREVSFGMEVSTDSDRVRVSRKLVFELMASAADVSRAGIGGWMERYGADPDRFGPPAPASGSVAEPGHHAPPRGDVAATVHEPPIVDNDLYVRDLSRCILCYKCVAACGIDAQNTFAITVAGRGFDARISTEFGTGLEDSACVFCGNCIGVCPTGALVGMVEFRMREDGTWDEESQSVTRTVCSFCGVGCNLDLHVQDNRIVKVTSPEDHAVTAGHLCIKGRFGWEHIQ